jgi:hypothetical protein
MVGRMAGAALAASVAALGTTASAGSAAAPEGAGAGAVTTSVLDASLGDLLGVTLLEDVAASTTDPKVAPVGATSVFRDLKLSSTISALNRVVGEHRVSAPQGPSDVTTNLLDLDSLGLGAVVHGTIEPLVMKALPNPSASTSARARVTDLGLLGGLAHLGVVNATDGTGSAPSGSQAVRAMSLDALSLLDLGKLLQGLGLDLLNLPLSVVSGLLTSFGIPVDLQGASSLAALVTSLRGSIDSLLGSLDASVFTVTAPVLSAIGSLGLPLPLQPALDSAVSTAVNALQSTLNTLISTVLGVLDSATLLKVNALDVATSAKAANTVGGSSATATGTLGSIQIGSIALPGIDLAAATAAVNDLLARITSALGNVLAPLGLGNLLSVRLFDRQAGVTESAGVVKAVSSITGMVVKLGAPSPALLGQLDQPQTGIGSLLTATNGRVAARAAASAADGSATLAASPRALVAAAANPLEGVLGVTSVLSKGLTLRIGTVQSQAVQAVPGSPVAPASPANPATPASPSGVATVVTPDGKLARTGGEETSLALVALGLGAMALGGRRLRRRAGL